MSKPKVYLAGPISDTTYEGAVSWRRYAADRLSNCGLEPISPMRGKEYFESLLADGATFNDAYDRTTHSYEALDLPLSTSRAIFHRDRWDVHRCDIVLAHLAAFEKVSIGTVMELTWAHTWNKLVVATLLPEDIHNHGMLKECMSIVVTDLETALHAVIAAAGAFK